MAVSIVTKNVTNTKLLNLLYANIQSQSYKNICEWILPSTCKTLFENISIIYSDSYKPSGDIVIYMNDDMNYCNTFIENCANSKSGELYINELYTYAISMNKLYKVFNMCNNKICTNSNYSVKSILHNQIIIKFLYSDNSEYYDNINSNINCVKLDDRVLNILLPQEYISNYINSEFINKTDIVKTYDIVYYLGEYGVDWHPSDNFIGGSEQAVVNLTKYWSYSGLNVAVCGKFKDSFVYNGIDFFPPTFINKNNSIKNLIIWRHIGIYGLLNKKLLNIAKNIILDFHDNVFTLKNINIARLETFLKYVNYINFKSEYHKKCYLDYFKENNIDISVKSNIIMNGLQINKLKNNNEIKRERYRFCYTSSYDRGLINILRNIWPLIKEKLPEAELHVYYGMDYIYDEKFKQTVQYLLGQKGVMEHGRCSLEKVINEKYRSSFHLYVSDTMSEIDCISIRESLVTGCIPLISNKNLFTERDGFHINIDSDNKTIVYSIVDLVNNKNKQSELREQFYNSKLIVSWDDIGNQWIKIFI